MDRERILTEKSWKFDNTLSILISFDGLTPPKQMSFNFEEFWIQLPNLPLIYMMRDIGTLIGKQLG